MTIRELIKILEKAPQDLPVMYYWDGAPRSVVQVVYIGLGYPEYFSGKTKVAILTSKDDYYLPVEDSEELE